MLHLLCQKAMREGNQCEWSGELNQRPKWYIAYNNNSIRHGSTNPFIYKDLRTDWALYKCIIFSFIFDLPFSRDHKQWHRMHANADSSINWRQFAKVFCALRCGPLFSIRVCIGTTMNRIYVFLRFYSRHFLIQLKTCTLFDWCAVLETVASERYIRS